VNYSEMPKILYADSDESSRNFVKIWMRTNAAGCTLTSVKNGMEALTLAKGINYSLYLFDYCLGDMTAPELCRFIRSTDTRSRVVVCSPFDREIDRKTAIDAGATDFIIKPEGFEVLRKIIRSLPRAESALRIKRRLFHSMRRSAAII